MTMRLYQPVLFVGLGGTGCQVGGELERRLREEICGPDGTEFQRLRPQGKLLPYQLPSCLQFVYADVNQADLDRLPSRVVPGPEHLMASRHTAHYVHDLVPHVDTYPEVAASLRLSAAPVVESWLPPPAGEPRVAPLQKGAGQLPTVGRAALFETFRRGVNPALRDLTNAVGRLSNSGDDLTFLHGRPPEAVDVFVAFSVAGGTGAGIFYDYLHLIGRVFEATQLRARIYPLVLMPSAFAEGLGGGRPAQLNAGRALLDLFRLVDEQNAGDVDRSLRSRGIDGSLRIDPDDVAVHYPVEGRVRLRPSTVQTAFLFSRPVGAQREDLHRSMVSLVLSLVGSEIDQDGPGGEAQLHQSFADSFINSSADRQVPAANGIGNRGVSTALVASLTVPEDELADLVAGRLLREAIGRLQTPPAGDQEINREHVERFFTVSGVGEVLTRQGIPFAEPEPVSGAKDIALALSDRTEAMQRALDELDGRLRREIPHLVDGFDPRAAVVDLLGDLDPFRALRVIEGDVRLRQSLDKIGAAGLMRRRMSEPASGQRFQAIPPSTPEMRDRLGLLRVKWTDPEAVEARETQDSWYTWRTRTLWARHWKDLRARWESALNQAEKALRELTGALLEHDRIDRDRFDARAEDLARPRVGVSYLLPPGGSDLEQFYDRVKESMIGDGAAQGRLPKNPSAANLVRYLIGSDGWRQAYRDTRELNAEQIVSRLRERIKTEVKIFLRTSAPGTHPLLPPLSDRLMVAAGLMGGAMNDDDVQEFRGKLAGMVPGAFEPQGHGALQVLVSYPSNAPNPQVEEYLKSAVHLPSGPHVTTTFRPTRAETVAVVLFRSSMGVTEVQEVREVLRTWASAQFDQQRQDHLRWRQRTGYDFSYLATRETHRVEILHHLLCALWNGKVEVTGDPESPAEIAVVLGGGIRMELQLMPLERSSSWGSVLRAYELWTLDDETGFRSDFCARLMAELPGGVTGRPTPPHENYLRLCETAARQSDLLDKMTATVPGGGSRPRVEQARLFWAQTFPAALDHPFSGTDDPVRSSLRELEAAVDWPEDNPAARR